MGRYHLSNLFRRARQSDGNTLYCDHSQCGKIILDSDVWYCPEDQKIYHPGYCRYQAQTVNPPIVDGSVIRTYEVIARERALELLNDRKLKQSRGLESKL